jgi:UrcA family protein
MLKILITSVALSAGLAFSQSAIAGAQLADLQPRRIVVSYDDLNLSAAAGADVVKHRIDAAARSACGPAPDIRDLADSSAFAACVSRAQASARVQLSAAMAHTRLAEAHR